jgi:hypothetical protein
MTGSQLAQNWLDRKLALTNDPNTARRDLFRFARAVYGRAAGGKDEGEALRAAKARIAVVA